MVKRKYLLRISVLAVSAMLMVTSPGMGMINAYADTTESDETDADAEDSNTASGDEASEPPQEAVDSEGVKTLSREDALKQATYKNKEDEILGHKFLLEKGDFEYYLNESNLSILVRNKLNGSIMESTVGDNDGRSNESWQGFMQSGIGIELQEDVNVQQSKLDLVNSKSEINITKNADGFSADVKYPDQGISLRMDVTMSDDGSFSAVIPDDSIKEENEKIKIGNIYVYPFLGYTYLGEREGYMFIPDGNGALINLDDKEGKFGMAYSQKVYGTDVGIDASYVLSLFWDKYETVNDGENVIAPIYGMVHTDSKMGYLAIIESGAEAATIEAYPNGAYTNYNWISSKFMKRTVYVQPTSNSGGSVSTLTDRLKYDIKIRYCFVSGDDANYTGLAKSYRNYLLEDGELKETADEFKMRLDFLGADRENWLFWKTAVTMTTVDNIKTIYQELGDEGITDIYSLYKGWQKGGVWSLPYSDYDVDKSLGSKTELNELIQDSEDKGIEFSLYENALLANPDTVNTTFNVIKKIDKRLYEEDTHKDVYETMKYLTPTRSNTLFTQLSDELTDAGIKNLALGGVGNNIFTYTYNGNTYYRMDSVNTYKEMFDTLSQNMNLSLDAPFACYWKYTKAITDMPVSDSDFIFTDEKVPFLSIALKGIIPMYSDYTNFEANKKEFFLQLVETGIYPSFYVTWEDPSDLLYTNSNNIYSSQFSTYKDEIVNYYKELKAVNEKTSKATIENHEREGDLVTVTYTNGVKVYVNYGEKEVQVDSITIPALSYKVGE